jgi:hypothetical protein
MAASHYARVLNPTIDEQTFLFVVF